LQPLAQRSFKSFAGLKFSRDAPAPKISGKSVAVAISRQKAALLKELKMQVLGSFFYHPSRFGINDVRCAPHQRLTGEWVIRKGRDFSDDWADL
jgi:hypothetical protein